MSSPPPTVIVTGAGGGLGKATATAFLAAGANVAVCDVHAARLAAAEAEWLAAGVAPGRLLAAAADVTDEAAVRALVAGAVARFGRLDVLVNNAGLMDNFSPVGECSREQWDRTMGVNVLGPFHTMRAAIAQFEAQAGGGAGPAGGVIVNILSVAAKVSNVGGAAYVTSKHALAGLSKNTAFHYAHKGIYSVGLVLGGMNTNITDGMKGLNMEAYNRYKTAHTPMDPQAHMLVLEDVSRYIVFLSDRAIAKGSNGALLDFTNNWPEA